MADAGEDQGMPRWVKLFAVAAVIVVVLVIVVMATGFGGEHGPGRHLPSTGTANSGGADGRTASPGGPAAAGEATRTVRVTTLDGMAFEPANITVAPGEVVTFAVTNAGQADHEFTLGDATMQQQRAAMRAHMGSAMPHDASNSVHVGPGETQQLTWWFGEVGALEYACHEPGHYEAGMRGGFTVA